MFGLEVCEGELNGLRRLIHFLRGRLRLTGKPKRFFDVFVEGPLE